jgi:hypothetical protein
VSAWRSDEAVTSVNAIPGVVGRFSVRAGTATAAPAAGEEPAGFRRDVGDVARGRRDVWVAINANVADGHDPSWLYDVPFEMLRGHRVYCFGDRRLDLATRLDYAGSTTSWSMTTWPRCRPPGDDLAAGELHRLPGLAGEVRRRDDDLRPLPRSARHLRRRRQRSGYARARASSRGRRRPWSRGYERRGARRLALPAGRGRGRTPAPGRRPAARVVFASRVAAGANVLAVCAGLQILGRTFCVEGDDEYEGLGLVDVVTRRGERRRSGELATRVDGDQLLVGFENHGGRTTLGGGSTRWARRQGTRPTTASSTGIRTKNIWATYAHGPVLAMNPWFCDEIIALVYGTRTRTARERGRPALRASAARAQR